MEYEPSIAQYSQSNLVLTNPDPNTSILMQMINILQDPKA